MKTYIIFLLYVTKFIILKLNFSKNSKIKRRNKQIINEI